MHSQSSLACPTAPCTMSSTMTPEKTAYSDEELLATLGYKQEFKRVRYRPRSRLEVFLTSSTGILCLEYHCVRIQYHGSVCECIVDPLVRSGRRRTRGDGLWMAHPWLLRRPCLPLPRRIVLL